MNEMTNMHLANTTKRFFTVQQDGVFVTVNGNEKVNLCNLTGSYLVNILHRPMVDGCVQPTAEEAETLTSVVKALMDFGTPDEITSEITEAYEEAKCFGNEDILVEAIGNVVTLL